WSSCACRTASPSCVHLLCPGFRASPEEPAEPPDCSLRECRPPLRRASTAARGGRPGRGRACGRLGAFLLGEDGSGQAGLGEPAGHRPPGCRPPPGIRTAGSGEGAATDPPGYERADATVCG